MIFRWIQPLELETWLVNVLSGSQEIFIAIALLVIIGMAGYFRMNGFGLFLILGVFLFMVTTSFSLIILLGVFGGLAIGYALSSFNR